MNTKYILSAVFAGALSLSSCTGDLDVQPLDPNIMTGDKAYAEEGAYLKGLLKIYSIWAMSGQDGAGSTDIDGLDAGNAQMMRCWWNLNELCTDEAKNAWANDTWVDAVNSITWNNVQNEAVEGAYQRNMFVVALANEYISQCEKADIAEKSQYIAEARFCRALSYTVLLDLFRNPPFIHEGNFSIAPAPIGDSEKHINPELFAWIVKELNECKTDLPAARQGEYGRADQGAVDFLLARLYLNAEVYTGEKHYTECIEACKNVIASGYTLADKYENIFLADNNITSNGEIIFPIVYNGSTTASWGGMTFLIMASINTDDAAMKEYCGVNGAWDGHRATGTFVDIFDYEDDANPTAATILDKRGLFYDDGRAQYITTTPLGTFTTEGWGVKKYRNVTSTGTVNNIAWPDTDFPLFRLADAYLMYAEAILRGGVGGDKAAATSYINQLRARGYAGTKGNISEGDLTLNFILDERARELYWEGVRRTDLIRFGKFTTGYNWDFKGGVPTGSNVDEKYIVYPIPTTDLTVNGNLVQNPGY